MNKLNLYKRSKLRPYNKSEYKDSQTSLNEIYEKLYQASEQLENRRYHTLIDDTITPWQQNENEIIVQNNEILRQIIKKPIRNKKPRYSEYNCKPLSISSINPIPLEVLIEHPIKPQTAPHVKVPRAEALRVETPDKPLIKAQKATPQPSFKVQKIITKTEQPNKERRRICEVQLSTELSFKVKKINQIVQHRLSTENSMYLGSKHQINYFTDNCQDTQVDQKDTNPIDKSESYKPSFVPFSENNQWGAKNPTILSKQTLILKQIKKALDIFTRSRRQDIDPREGDEFKTLSFKQCKNRISNIQMIRHNIQIKIRKQQKELKSPNMTQLLPNFRTSYNGKIVL